jgi:arabinogalactan endo-1,4-beta-galactosidase
VNRKIATLMLAVSSAFLGRAQPLTTTGSQAELKALPSSKADRTFLIGAGLSWVPQQEAEGRRYSEDGVQHDILEILKRLRDFLRMAR